MSRSVRLSVLVPAILAAAAVAFSQPAKFEDVVRNLRNPDPKIRVSAVRLLREAGYAEAIGPMAPLVNDPVNEIQLEAIASELVFFLVEPVPPKKRVAFVWEVRTEGRGPAAFAAGPFAAWPRTAPPELIDALLTAIDDDDKKVRLEAVYTLGVVAGASGAPLPDAAAARLVKALDHYDARIRAGAAQVIGRLRIKSASEGLLKAVNDSSSTVRFASIRALGEIGDEQTAQTITEQLNYYERGEGAVAALSALGRLAHPSSVPVFQSYLTNKDPLLRRAAVEGLAHVGDVKTVEQFVQTVNQDEAEQVRAAMAFALHKKGFANYLGRMIDFMDHDQSAEQIQGYLLELGPSVVPYIVPRLQEPDEGVRGHLAEVLGALGNQSTVTVLTPLKNDANRDVANAATHAIERIKMAQK
jgi:HEAT repeat protein